MARVTVTCPGCEARLNLPDASKLGKKIKCPKCSDIFVAKTEDDDLDEELDEEVAPSRSSRGRKRPAAAGKKPPGKKKPSKGGANVPLIAGGVVALVALIGIGLFLAGFFSSKPQQVAQAPAPQGPPPITANERILALRWMPPDTEALVHFKVADIWQAPLMQSFVNESYFAPVAQTLTQYTGLKPTEIESVTMGFSDVDKTNPMAVVRAGGSKKIPGSLIVVRTKVPMSITTIQQAVKSFQMSEYNSKPVLISLAAEDDLHEWLAEPQTLVLGPMEDLKKAMDRGETVIQRKELMFMDASPHVVVIGAPKNPKRDSVPPLLPSMSTEAGKAQQALAESMSALGLGLNVRGGFDLQTHFVLANPEASGTVKKGFEVGLADGRKQFETQKAALPPVLVELAELLLGNAKIDEQSQIVKFSTELPDSAQEKIQQVPMLILYAMSGLGGEGFRAPPGAAPQQPGVIPSAQPLPSQAQ